METLFQHDLEILQSALAQEDWRVECLSKETGQPPKLVRVSSFKIDEKTLFLLVESDFGLRTLLEIEVQHLILREDYSPERAAETQYARRIVVADVFFDGKDGKRVVSDDYWQKIDTAGGIGVVLVRGVDAPPGWPLDTEEPYGYSEHMKRYGGGDNLLRTEHAAQPQALRPGDVLATGDRVLSHPRRGFNGRVLVHMTGGTNGSWISMAAHLPIALLAKNDDVPPEMWTLR